MTSTKTPTLPALDVKHARYWVAYGFGAGLSPVAPGTVGTLVAVPIYLLLSPLPTLLYLIVLGALIAVGVWACESVAQELGQDDPSAIVWDEILGFLVAMIAVPSGLIWVVAGFLLFRLFDVKKPWPINIVQRRGGKFSIILDDLIAGAMTWVVLHGLALIVEASNRGAHGLVPAH
jgi:phosphatidylglycerophosphatase A